MKSAYQAISWSTIAWRALLLSLMWWALSDGHAQSWWIGLPAVALALSVSLMLVPPVPLVWGELFKFSLFFLWRSLQGGMDVAQRAFHPQLPIAPDLITYPLRLPPGLPRMFLVNSVSLLPGTLSADLTGRALRVHVLDGRRDVMSDLEILEQYVARLAGISLAAVPIGEK